jgi:hypothetical protein
MLMPRRSTQAESRGLERLGRRLDRHLAELAGAERGWLSRIRQQAHDQALRSLGLATLQAEWNALAAQQRELRHQGRALRRAMLATVRRVPIDTLGAYRGHRPHPDVRQALEQRRAVHEAELLACEARGQELLRLRRERAGLAEAVWLATAPRPLQALWQSLLTLLGQEPTALQQQALARGTSTPPAAVPGEELAAGERQRRQPMGPP